ncbi:hypothetical protein CYY_000648 [Polysphondylium violaceum]|uniref:Saposin B-type domain-containing protein n=1 Tax=Polysphondylium violaceum TaxID=133409 RepID=A0A8J4Q3F1_9MYCE|nr:hypothetical protein CYY_000648 [Polysphondylium violaceum]
MNFINLIVISLFLFSTTCHGIELLFDDAKEHYSQEVINQYYSMCTILVPQYLELFKTSSLQNMSNHEIANYESQFCQNFKQLKDYELCKTLVFQKVILTLTLSSPIEKICYNIAYFPL